MYRNYYCKIVESYSTGYEPNATTLLRLNMDDAQPGLAGGVARVTPPGHGGVIDAAFMVMDLTACGFLAIELA